MSTVPDDRINELLDLFNKIFDESGNVRNCGRDVCKEFLKKLHETYIGSDFGDEKSGFMDLNAILMWHKSVMKQR